MSGQINRGSELGEAIFEISRNEKYKNFLEIGTWNGQGSTKCFIDGLKLRSDNDWSFKSIESNLNFFKMAVDFHKSDLEFYKGFDIIHGIISGEDDISETKFDLQSLKDQSLFKSQYEVFLKNDLDDYEHCLNLHLNEKFDVILLDGGEFTTYSEFLKLKDFCGMFILDDSNMLKNLKVVNCLLSDSEWDIISQSNDRNGFCIFERT